MKQQVAVCGNNTKAIVKKETGRHHTINKKKEKHNTQLATTARQHSRLRHPSNIEGGSNPGPNVLQE